MKAVALDALAADPDSRPVVFAKDQPEYEPLPALIFSDGKVLTEWQLTEEERARILAGENIRLWIWTCGQPLQPVALEITGKDDAHREP
jgi:hypothetical protein